MSRPTHAEIDIPAFIHNYRYAKSLAPQAHAVAVVKANAYGHGAVPLSRALAGEADAFGVACLEEALELRDSGIDNDIVLLEGVFEPDELAEVDRRRLIQVVHSPHQLQWLLKSRPAHRYRVWLKFDSGMHRLGFGPKGFGQAQVALQSCGLVKEIVPMTHFACADEPSNPRTSEQLAAFRHAAGGFAQTVSLANSAAMLAWPETRRGWTRPGIMLYGASPLDTALPAGDALRPVMQLQSSLIAVRELQAGQPVGYGGRFVCDRPMRIGVVAIGYGDGYPRHAIDGTPVAIDGVRSRLVGRVSMDMLTVDLGPVPDAGPGSRVELWGRQVAATEVAQHADTIAYTLFTGITRRVPLSYREHA